jgi:hypothetical protein
VPKFKGKITGEKSGETGRLEANYIKINLI